MKAECFAPSSSVVGESCSCLLAILTGNLLTIEASKREMRNIGTNETRTKDKETTGIMIHEKLKRQTPRIETPRYEKHCGKPNEGKHRGETVTGHVSKHQSLRGQEIVRNVRRIQNLKRLETSRITYDL
jgi:hypothetical protein